MKYSLFYLCLLCLLCNCSKSPKHVKPAGIYSEPGEFYQECKYLFPTNSGGYVMLSTNTNSTVPRFHLSRFDDKGNKEWTKPITGLSTNHTVSLNSDGGISVLMTDGQNRILRLNKDGEILYNTWISDSAHYGYSEPLFAANNHTYTMYFKPAAWLGNTNQILEFDESGNWLKNNTQNTTDGILGGLINNQVLYKVELPSTFYFCGLIYLFPVNLSGNAHVFTAKVEYDALKKVKSKTVKIIDPANTDNINMADNFRFLHTPDDHLIIGLTRQLPGDKPVAHLFKIDASFNTVWEKDLIIGQSGVRINSIRISPVGDYLLAGTCRMSGKSFDQPFLAVVNQSGNLAWHKIYDTPLNSKILSAFQYADGRIRAGGYTAGFGSGRYFADLFLILTDEKGNVK